MVFNGNTDEHDIVSYIADATGLNKTAHIKKITRAANSASREIWSVIFEAYGGWQYDDTNNADLPTATADLVASQSKYTIPTDALTIRQVSVKDESGFWRDLKAITTEDIHSVSAENEFQDTAGNPRFYRMFSNVIELYPAPNYSQTRSIRVQFDRGSTTFSSDATDTSPGFASEFHDAVHIGASYMIGADKNLKNVERKYRQWVEIKENIREYYKARFVELNSTETKSYLEDPLTSLN